jgi:hypothetical protein
VRLFQSTRCFQLSRYPCCYPSPSLHIARSYQYFLLIVFSLPFRTSVLCKLASA